MINEQREAIKILKEIQESNRAWLMQTKEENCEKIYLKDIEAIDTVLSLIKEQDKYIKDSNDITEEMNRDIMILIYKLKQKDKQIDLMAKYIDKIDVSEDFCEGRTWCDEDCENCIKQYFADLVEKE